MGRLPIDVAGSSLAYEVIDICLDHQYQKMSGGPQSSGATDDAASSHGFGSRGEPG